MVISDILQQQVLMFLSLLLSVYVVYLKTKFKEYAKIDGKLQSLDKLEVIEKSLDTIKKHSEFEYHKKKEDLKNLELLFENITRSQRKVLQSAIHRIKFYIELEQSLKKNEDSCINRIISELDDLYANDFSEYDTAEFLFNAYFNEYDCKGIQTWFYAFSAAKCCAEGQFKNILSEALTILTSLQPDKKEEFKIKLSKDIARNIGFEKELISAGAEQTANYKEGFNELMKSVRQQYKHKK
jgi:hypothetical protein